MYINPKVAVREGWITFPETVDIEKHLQPNAIDFDLDKLFSVSTIAGNFVLDGDYKQHLKRQPVEEEHTRLYGETPRNMFKLAGHSWYDFASSFHVHLPEGVAAGLIVRSTLNRNGLFITSGLYDQGFSGNVAGALHNRSAQFAYISRGSRIGQIQFFSAESSGTMYAGGYNTAFGQTWLDNGEL